MNILYKKDSKGKIRYLKIYSEGSTIINEAGIIGTDNPVIHRKEAKAKNIGKSNETTPEEQADLEIISYGKKKLDEGYKLTIEEAENDKVILPMLAKDYNKESKKIDWVDCYVQPKLDGMRCLAYLKNDEIILLSRKGVEIENMDHIKKDLEGIFELFPDVILDGELYVHGEGFQTNMSYIKKYKAGFSERISYCVYDLISEESFYNRHSYLNNILYSIELVSIKIVNRRKVGNFNQIQENHSEYLSQGYEGTMVRWGNEPYKIDGRSSNLLKYKDFIDIQLPLLDVIPAEQRPEWGIPVFEGFRAGVRMTHEERIDLLENKTDYIGKIAEIRFFEYTDDGLPRFPILIGFRNDK